MLRGRDTEVQARVVGPWGAAGSANRNCWGRPRAEERDRHNSRDPGPKVGTSGPITEGWAGLHTPQSPGVGPSCPFQLLGLQGPSFAWLVDVFLHPWLCPHVPLARLSLLRILSSDLGPTQTKGDLILT